MGWGTCGLRQQGDVVQQCVKGAWLGPKTKNQAPGARFWLAKCGWAGIWVEGTLMGGVHGLRWQGDVVWWCMKGAWWGPKTKNQAPGAQFWLAKCEWAGFWVEGTLMGWGTSV